MATKEWAFELEDGEEITLDLEYTYSYTPAYTSGLPENCYPEESEEEVKLPSNLAELVKKHYMEVVVPQRIKQIESMAQDLILDGVLAEWDAEDGRDAAESAAGDAYEDRMYDLKYGRD
jgi:hypothetical protein